jgi:hypothetical protein
MVLHLVGEMDGVRSTLDLALPRKQAMSLVGEIVRAIQNTMGEPTADDHGYIAIPGCRDFYLCKIRDGPHYRTRKLAIR